MDRSNARLMAVALFIFLFAACEDGVPRTPVKPVSPDLEANPTDGNAEPVGSLASVRPEPSPSLRSQPDTVRNEPEAEVEVHGLVVAVETTVEKKSPRFNQVLEPNSTKGPEELPVPKTFPTPVAVISPKPLPSPQTSSKPPFTPLPTATPIPPKTPPAPIPTPSPSPSLPKRSLPVS